MAEPIQDDIGKLTILIGAPDGLLSHPRRIALTPNATLAIVSPGTAVFGDADSVREALSRWSARSDEVSLSFSLDEAKLEDLVQTRKAEQEKWREGEGRVVE